MIGNVEVNNFILFNIEDDDRSGILFDWLNKNRLLLNVKKSSCMLIGTKQRISGNDNLKIMIGDDMLTAFPYKITRH